MKSIILLWHVTMQSSRSEYYYLAASETFVTEESCSMEHWNPDVETQS